MSDVTTETMAADVAGAATGGSRTRRRIHRHRGRAAQIVIYLGKFLRMFVYQNDWKVLPMAAVIAALVAMVVKEGFCVSMEGTLKGAFALVCVSIWNGFFNSIQVIVRERGMVKREHRSGMYISSYVLAHMIYQALLCLAQTVLTLYIFVSMGVKLPEQGFMSSHPIGDFGVTVFLVTYAADMMSLFVSAVTHSTTAAMTVMPFLLIFQLVFSGGIFSLPTWAQPISSLTISSYGLNCIAAQADYNSLPMVSGWNTLFKLRNNKIEFTVSVDDFMEMFSGLADPAFLAEVSAGVKEDLGSDTIPVSFSVKDMIDIVGESTVRDKILTSSSEASQQPLYAHTRENIADNWFSLTLFVFFFGFLTIGVLQFIDKDRR